MAQEAQVSGPMSTCACCSIVHVCLVPERHREGPEPVAVPPQHRFELGRQPANTKLSSNVSVRRVRVRGGNSKFRALRLDSGNFSWGSEAVTRKTRVLDVVYNASNNELVSDSVQLQQGARISAWEISSGLHHRQAAAACSSAEIRGTIFAQSGHNHPPRCLAVWAGTAM